MHRGGTSPHERRSQPSMPVENGLGEPEYRYRSPTASSDHQHRQQSPAMLPPGAQPSPTLR